MELILGGILFLIVIIGVGCRIKEHYPDEAKTVEPEEPTNRLYLSSKEED